MIVCHARSISFLLLIVGVVLQLIIIPYRTSFWSRSPIHTINSLRAEERPLTRTQSIAHNERIPSWLIEYFSWHKEMRLNFPDRQLFEHPDAPKVLVRVCVWQCGGLNDRLSGLPLDIYIANSSRRILLIKWTFPHNLEEFMVPNSINWTVPSGVGLDGNKEIKLIPQFAYHRGGGPGMLEAMAQVCTGDLATKKVVRSSCLAGDGEVAYLQESPVFGYIFHSLFQPSPPVQAKMNHISKAYNLVHGLYTAVHCRIRHPKGVPRCQGLVGREGGPADRSGLSFQQNFTRGRCNPNEKGLLVGSYKDFAVTIATHAMDCAHYISPESVVAIYFMSDSNDTVAAMIGQDSPFAGSGVAIASSYSAFEVTLHIDRQHSPNVSDYYGVFVDLFLASQAQCVSYGIGNYGIMATKISGTNCTIQHRSFLWETGEIPGSRNGSQCPPSPHRKKHHQVR